MVEETKETTIKEQGLLDAIKEFKIQNDRREKLLAEEKEIIAHKMLSGSGDLPAQPAEKKEETPIEYKDRLMKGGLANE